MTNRESPSGQGPARLLILFRLALVALAIVLLNIGTSWVIERLEIQVWPEHMEIVDRLVLTGMVLYILLMALPFLPGVEIGLALMMLLGTKGIVLIYLCTLLALSIGFGIGRFLPAQLLISLLRWLQLMRAEALLRSFDEIPPEGRLQFLAEKASPRVVSVLLKRRYLLLALLLNLPGNVVIGGGGGIAMIAGMSRLYSFPKYLLLIAVAILPGPIVVILSNAVQ